MLTDFEQAEAFAKAMDAGDIVRCSCFCTFWWLVRCDVGSRCLHCDEPMVADEEANR